MSDNGHDPLIGELRMTDSIKDLAKALPKAQANIGAAKKDGKNPHFHSTFATLESVIESIREPLYNAGLSFVQMPIQNPKGIGLTTLLIHESGQWIGSTMVLPIDTQKGRTDVQAAGSTITYMRRYALLSLLGIPTEDDDGNDAGPRRGDPPRAETSTRSSAMTTKAQLGMFKGLVRKLGLTQEQVQIGLDSRGYHGSGFADLTKSQGSEIIDDLEARVEETNAEGQ